MAKFIVWTPSGNSYIGQFNYLMNIELHKINAVSERMKTHIKRLKIGEAVQFPNGLKVKCVNDDYIFRLSELIKPTDRKTYASPTHTKI